MKLVQHVASPMCLAALLALTLGACGSDDTGGEPPPDNTPALSPEDAVDGMLTAACAKLFACRDSFPFGGPETFDSFFGTTEKDCKLVLVDQFGLNGVTESVEAGRIVYDAEKGAACVEEVNAQLDATTCDELWSQDPSGLLTDSSCGAMLEGQIAIGEACNNNFECVPGSQCTGGTCIAAS
ncbi:MAG: hypothetical protein IPL79_14470 [Myxococcales bacterium]|nr:hypothetical protein [Myxococcales bacterium]